MTRKDYERLAAALHVPHLTKPDDAATHMHTTLCQRLADALQAENPRFDRGRFLAACGARA